MNKQEFESVFICVIGIILLTLSYRSASAEQPETCSMSVRTGASYGVLGTEMNFTNIMVDYEKWFYKRYSIAGEFQKSCRVYPGDGNLYAFAGVMRYYLFDDAWKGYGLGGGGVAFPDFDNGSDGNMLFHLVAGLGVERKWNRFALAFEGRYEHESNCFTGGNYGMDKLMFLVGGKWYLGKIAGKPSL